MLEHRPRQRASLLPLVRSTLVVAALGCIASWVGCSSGGDEVVDREAAVQTDVDDVATADEASTPDEVSTATDAADHETAVDDVADRDSREPAEVAEDAAVLDAAAEDVASEPCEGLSAGAGCDDGDPCTVDDVCDGGGRCEGTPRVCEAPGPCDSAACDGATGECTVGALSDGAVCGGGTCEEGACVCPEGFEGPACEDEVPPAAPAGFVCVGSVCKNEATREAWIPAGEFWMGCNAALDDACEAGEYEQHHVTLSAYAIDLTHVTAGAYLACVEAGACQALPFGTSHDPATANHPVDFANHAEAVAFCSWDGKAAGAQRLCTEAEWERAARGGCETVTGDCAAHMRVYPWDSGDGSAPIPPTLDHANVGATASGPVGQFSPAGDSPYGVQDMGAYPQEMVSDRASLPIAPHAPEAVVDPTGPEDGTFIIIRGAAVATRIRASFRALGYTNLRTNMIGFRCCRSLPLP